MQAVDSIFYIVVLILSVIIHEISHGYAALYFGDQTAKLAGRLTLNPLKHLDPFGSVLIPLFLVILHSPFLIGWARPVPFNPHNLRNQKLGTLWVAAAGILSNFLIAIIFGLTSMIIPVASEVKTSLFQVILNRGSIMGVASNGLEAAVGIMFVIILVNIVLAIFNLVPLPPLDGSRILFTLLGNRFRQIEFFLERYAIFVLLIFIFFLWQKIAPIVFSLFKLFTGVSF
ncbi:hypothetical protein A2645_01640 [Candidatus Nomurabacteria bacterium RIFCSPHIGHO2_01_FULL_39_9]|uniref:Peptidase M50 domain-containing protein n=1 Tax=Candidatus Nomurabacteria bacterium RIFCSPHIGHO2_01_FULL_39_9 TaxID=1801735 RepID=A0A1F6UUZ1_9BACT|nr:MAG: hypothetical protein A2645_01640 [Candidatus Nomurabacteria bacterium RIFCSPHIGHO2_01_FULL_39_9]